MPTYVYRREDGSTFEIQQKISDDPLEMCPETGQPVTRLISGGSFHLKGSGFYETDYVRNNGDESSDSSSENTTTDTESTSSESDSSENGNSKTSTEIDTDS